MNRTLEELSLDDKYKLFTEKGYYDISNGFPFTTSQELFEVLYNKMLMNEITRLPIIATEQGIFIQTQPSQQGKIQHSTLAEEIKVNSEQIIFATGIEAFSLTEPTSKIYITVPFTLNGNSMVGYWSIKESSDHFDKPLIRDEAYIDKIKNIFESIPGVKFHY